LKMRRLYSMLEKTVGLDSNDEVVMYE